MNPKSKVARLARALQDILGLSADDAQGFAWFVIFELAIERARESGKEHTNENAVAA